MFNYIQRNGLIITLITLYIINYHNNMIPSNHIHPLTIRFELVWKKNVSRFFLPSSLNLQPEIIDGRMITSIDFKFKFPVLHKNTNGNVI